MFKETCRQTTAEMPVLLTPPPPNRDAGLLHPKEFATVAVLLTVNSEWLQGSELLCLSNC